MVAKITIPKNVEAALNYNENKVQRGTAECLKAVNYLSEAKNMNFYQKLNGFESLNCLNKRATTKTLHISLNFDPSERLSNDKLIEIASMYMEDRFWRTTISCLQTYRCRPSTYSYCQ